MGQSSNIKALSTKSRWIKIQRYRFFSNNVICHIPIKVFKIRLKLRQIARMVRCGGYGVACQRLFSSFPWSDMVYWLQRSCNNVDSHGTVVRRRIGKRSIRAKYVIFRLVLFILLLLVLLLFHRLQIQARPARKPRTPPPSLSPNWPETNDLDVIT